MATGDWDKKISSVEKLAEELDATHVAKVTREWRGRLISTNPSILEHISHTFNLIIARIKDFIQDLVMSKDEKKKIRTDRLQNVAQKLNRNLDELLGDMKSFGTEDAKVADIVRKDISSNISKMRKILEQVKDDIDIKELKQNFDTFSEEVAHMHPKVHLLPEVKLEPPPVEVTEISEEEEVSEVEEVPSVPVQEHIRSLITQFNHLGHHLPSERKKAAQQLRSLCKEIGVELHIPHLPQPDARLADEIIALADQIGLKMHLVGQMLSLDIPATVDSLHFDEKRAVDRLQYLMPFQRGEELFQEIVSRQDAQAALTLLVKIFDLPLEFTQSLSAKKYDENMQEIENALGITSVPRGDASLLLERFHRLSALARPLEEKKGAPPPEQPSVESKYASLLEEEDVRGVLHRVFDKFADSSAGGTYLERGGKLYVVGKDRHVSPEDLHGSDVDQFLRKKQEKEIIDALENQAVGSYFVTNLMREDTLFKVTQPNTVESYPFNPTGIRYDGHSTAQKRIRVSYPNIEAKNIIHARPPALSVMQHCFDKTAAPGTYFTATFAGTEVAYVLTDNRKVMALEYSRRGSAYIYRGKTYYSLKQLVDAHFPKATQQAVTIRDAELKKHLGSVPGSFCEIGLANNKTSLYVVTPGRLWGSRVEKIETTKEEYVTIHGKEQSIAKFIGAAGKETIVPFQQFYSLKDDVLPQLKKIEALCCPCKNEDVVPLLSRFHNVTPLPFFLRRGEKGVFTVVAGISRDKKGVSHPRVAVDIKLLPSGKVQCLSDDMIYNNFEEFKEAYELGPFYYDYVVSSESNVSTKEQAEQALLATPMNCFLLWKSEKGKMYVTAKEPPKTSEIEHRDGKFIMEGEEIKSELLSYLQGKERFGSSYKASQAFMNAFGAKLEHGAHIDDPSRFSPYLSETPLYTIALDGEKVYLTQMTRTVTETHYMLVPEIKIETKQYALQLLHDGTVLMLDTKTKKTKSVSLSQLQKELAEQDSVKELEMKRTYWRAHVRACVRDAKEAHAYMKSEQEALEDIQDIWSKRGHEIQNRCFIFPKKKENELGLVYKDAQGKTQKVTLRMLDDGIHVVGQDSIKPVATLEKALHALHCTPLDAVRVKESPKYRFFTDLSKSAGYIEGGKVGVEKAFYPYLEELSHTHPPYYAITIDQDKEGINQVFVSFVDDNKSIQHLPITLKSTHNIEKEIAKQFSCITPFTQEQKHIHEIHERSLANKERIRKEANFFDLPAEVVRENFEAIKHRFGEEVVRGMWAIVPQEASWIPIISMPDVTRCTLLFYDTAGKYHELPILVSSSTGKFLVRNERFYDTLDELLEAHGATPKASYHSYQDQL